MGEESAVWANAFFAIPLGIIMFLVYCLLRPRMLLFYNRNIMIGGRAFVRIPKGFFGWFSRILDMPDAEYLAVAGLDAYSAIALMKLMLMLCCSFALLSVLILAPYYYWHSASSTVKFSSFTIASLYEKTFWLPMTIQLLLTIMTIYSLYYFSASFVPLRQAFLAQPSAMVPLGQLAKVADSLGSWALGRKFFDARCKTVILHPIPGDVSLGQLETLLRSTGGLGGIRRVQRVGVAGKVMAALNARNRTLRKLETCLKTLGHDLKLQRKKEAKAEIDLSPIPIADVSPLVKRLLTDPSYLKDVRPRHKSSSTSLEKGKDGKVDSLMHFYQKLAQREEALQAAIQEYSKSEALTDTIIPEDRDENLTTTPETIANDAEQRYLDETTFISWEKVLQAPGDEVAWLGGSQWAALIHFESAEDANRASQLLLSSRLNQLVLRSAPSAPSLLPGNLNVTPRERFWGACICNTLYLILLFTFAPLMTLIFQFIDTKELAAWFPVVSEFQERFPFLMALIEGIIAPYVVLRLMKTTPKWIAWMLSFRRPESIEQLQLMLQRATLFFFFFQLLVLTSFFSSTRQVYNLIAAGRGVLGLLKLVRDTIPLKAHYFFMFFLLSVAIEMMMELVNPYSMILQRDTLTTWRRKKKLPRELLVADGKPLESNCGVIMSRHIIYPFFVVMTYAVIAPLILIPAIIYYAAVFVVLKQRMFYTSRGEIETGGEFWRQAAPHVLNALLLGQFSLILQMSLFRQSYPGMFVMVVVFGVTWLGVKPFFARTFSGPVWRVSTMVEGEMAKIRQLLAQYEANQQEPQRMKEIFTGMHCGPIVASEFGETVDAIDTQREEYAMDDTASDNGDGNKTTRKKEIDRLIVKPHWYMCPLEPILQEEIAVSGGTFDPLHVDHLVDVKLADRPYSHPGLLSHSQVLILPVKLAPLLQEYNNNKNAEKAEI